MPFLSTDRTGLTLIYELFLSFQEHRRMKIKIQEIFEDNYFITWFPEKREIRILQQANSSLGNLYFAQMPLPFFVEVTSLHGISRGNVYISPYILLQSTIIAVGIR